MSSKEIIAAVNGALDDSWQSAQEIADKLQIRVFNVRAAISRLHNDGLVSSHGEKPIRYRLREKPDESGQETRPEYRGEPVPYMRQGSYTPRSHPTITIRDSGKV
ncbi:hypothetical protein B1757_02590 [Acidithiobacillus marinus]|uniref:Uncharacterized protein n=1 Tax=Acidithiobacillus marinus TaxID=187490 RepID=A0A2I1DPR9_9PROT|nr:hypothetical protein [Acidithiobacillus marinus]PKY11866.1 hypothetical protein B1757_02590 [Acidithiobacillus marinus]